MKYHHHSESGYSFASITTAHSPIAVVYISADVHGAPVKNLSATALLYAEVLKSGAGALDREAFIDAQNQLGASISVTITDNVATFTIKCRSEVLPKVLSLFTLMVTEPRFEKKEIIRAKGLLTNLLHEGKEESKTIAHYELRNALYGAEDRRHTMTEDELIAKLKIAEAKQLTALHLTITQAPWVVSTTGNSTTVALVAAAIKKLKKTYATKITDGGNHQPLPPRAHMTFRTIPSRQNIDFSIGVGVPITVHHPDFHALTFGLAVLGKWGGFAGRLMSTVREQEGLTYGIYARTEGFYGEEQGYWRIMTFFSPAQALTGLKSTYREISKLYTEGISEAELNAFKQILTTGEALLADSTLSQLRDLHAYHQQGFSLSEMQAHKQAIATLSVTEVNEAIAQYLNPKQLTISAAGPINKKTEAELKAFFKSVT